MRKSIKALAIASAVIAGLAVAPALYAHDSEESGDSMMGSGMMGQGGMMGMMGQMSEMMEGCNRMMQSMSHDGSGRPNEQWREKSPDNNGAPGTNG
ncbi:hypothetical protein [Mesorhizobium sp. Z1-4]|uniref:hypothetical protein n=1 Tax=Mesorhizobium sp. Z1-4 TaxID=2448478 RepID=UPI0019801B5F|nr:hypothetical protein [Mesorhizobium sp. Z1-4]